MSEFGQQLFFDLPFFYFGDFCCFSDYQNHSWILYIIGHFISLLEQYVHAENISSSGPYIVSAAVLTTHQDYFLVKGLVVHMHLMSITKA